MKMTEPAADDWRELIVSAVRAVSRIAVLGIGSDLRGDDAAGVLCVRELGKVWGLSRETMTANGRAIFLLDGGDTPESQTGPLRTFRPDLVILIDAARGGARPGTIFRVEPNRISDEEISTHRISLAMLVRFLETSLKARVLFLGIEPAAIEWKMPISASVRTGVRLLAEILVNSL
jgi:hydrogenase 3 maturation protease